jgi:hypothetical protein
LHLSIHGVESRRKFRVDGAQAPGLTLALTADVSCGTRPRCGLLLLGFPPTPDDVTDAEGDGADCELTEKGV